MNNCPYEKYFIDYIKGELDQTEILDFQVHLKNCSTCPVNLDEFYRVHYAIKNKKRPEAKPDLIADFHKNLSYEFSNKFKTNNWIQKVFDLYWSFFGQRSWSVKFAEVFSLTLIGVLIGWLLFNSQPDLQKKPITQAQYYPGSASKQEAEYLNYYFQATELLLLELKNIDDHTLLNNAEVEFNKNVAQKLLIKTFIIHEIALRQNDPKILRFLSKMELLLYEISNTPKEEFSKSISSLNIIIDSSNLLDEAQKFRKAYVRFQVVQPDDDTNIKK